MKPASLLPFEVVEFGKYARLYPRWRGDPSCRSGLPLPCVALRQRQTGAKRGLSPRLLGFDPEEMQDLRYLAHAANAYPRLVAALRWVVRSTKAYAGQHEEAAALLRELGEAE